MTNQAARRVAVAVAARDHGAAVRASHGVSNAQGVSLHHPRVRISMKLSASGASAFLAAAQAVALAAQAAAASPRL